ncbi:hypothetical protein LMG33818_000028 [Halomonadaceae bacterium LMG 33818]|uniref:type II toxin-antitoxin system HicA family toxin n=1 Tax=Cernens ardua TaxID=3402176 RepID=UPI003EDC8DFF
MTSNEFHRWLKSRGVIITSGKGRHGKKATYNGITVPLPDHGKKEIGTGIVNKIKKELGL